jgi:hypothetical protein
MGMEGTYSLLATAVELAKLFIGCASLALETPLPVLGNRVALE